jgi:hypothetical protein
MLELRKDICSAAFFFECAYKSCNLIGAFAEPSAAANAYRGELLGLLALHLILLAVNKVTPGLQGSITLHSDCLGAISRVASLPPGKIPTICKHADVLKTILIACDQLTFHRKYEHVEAHQDDEQEFGLLSRAAQLNCAVDAGAKRELLSQIERDTHIQLPLPLEPITCFAGRRKITPDTRKFTQFWIHRSLARSALSDLKVVYNNQFDEIAWEHVHAALCSVPRLFQLWACKQVLGLAHTNGTVNKWDRSVDPRCPSCKQAVETTEHVLACTEAGRVEIFLQTVGLLDQWLGKMDTDPDLRTCIVEFCQGRGYRRMGDICSSLPDRFQRMAVAQDTIGWRRFLEGMIAHRIVDIQREFLALRGMTWKLDKWAAGLSIRLLEVTHGQWLYRNVVVHDAVVGSLASIRKEEIEAQIEAQLLRGGDGLLEEDAFLMEVNLGELSESSGQQHEYWLLAIKAARIAGQLAQGRQPTDGTDYG